MAKKEKKNGKGGAAGALIAGIILLLGGGAWGTGLLPGSDGIGNGNGDISAPTSTSAPIEETNKNDKVEKTVVILLNQAEITIDGEVCADANELYTKINSMYSENSKITFEYKEEYPIKSKKEAVIEKLKDAEKALKIDIKGIE